MKKYDDNIIEDIIPADLKLVAASLSKKEATVSDVLLLLAEYFAHQNARLSKGDLDVSLGKEDMRLQINMEYYLGAEDPSAISSEEQGFNQSVTDAKVLLMTQKSTGAASELTGFLQRSADGLSALGKVNILSLHFFAGVDESFDETVNMQVVYQLSS